MFPGGRPQVLAKVERFNPGGSVKDRSGLSMLREALRNGEITPGRSVVVESSSGNLAVGLAQACRYLGLRFICVVDAKTTEQNLSILRAYGAEVDVVEERDTETGEFLPVRLRRVRELLDGIPNSYTPDQYGNLFNPRAHESTMREIAEALGGRLDYLFCSVGTFGTLRGCSDYIRDAGLGTKVVAVDAVGSAIFGQRPTRRLIPGHGASVRPALMDPDAADEVVHVTDLDCVVQCRRLVDQEAILAGGSSGATLAAFAKMLPRIPPESVCALIFPDGGDRYLKTIYSDVWVRETFGEVSHLWKD
ncbi:2,3-diaminopropionate biosynthesis protein SbnA [Streptomyces sp. 11-1-2]|uniref:2,3-diaminopropionate biosynthesis protein SbnA n=2 Tax=Streptomyces TaxID=1883 RepID=UPI0031FEF447